MKKRNLLIPLISLFSIILCGCSDSSRKLPPYDANLIDFTATCDGLAFDDRENYEIDEKLSNANGSMSYEIFVRSFYDSNNDGIGDLKGVETKLDYLSDMGIKTLWLMPINPSPSYHGYDVSDYYGINEDYGTMGDFESLVSKAKEKNIDIMIDMVLNHSSDKISWFAQSYQDFKTNKTGPDSKADWYCWDEHGSSGYARYQDLYYEARFDASMPDLNWDSASLRNELDNVIKFWIDKGVKGFRLDAVLYYYFANNDQSIEVLNWIKDTCTKYDPDFYIVGECWADNNVLMKFYESKCDSFFKFSSSFSSHGDQSFIPLVKGVLRANTFANDIENIERIAKEKNPDSYMSYFLSNHDMDRVAFSCVDYKAKMLASIYCLMPGTPFMYYGEEIMMKGMRKSVDYSDARRRLPMVWSSTSEQGKCGFPELDRDDLMDNEQVIYGVDDHLKTPYSLVSHYQKVINVRNKYPFMKHGIFTNKCKELNTDNDKVLAYEISLGNEKIVIIHNINEAVVEVDVSAFAGMQIDSTINTARLIPALANNKLKIGHYSTVILK